MKKINRRTVLRGAGGIALGLPWLEATAQSIGVQKNVRLGFLLFPNGAIPKEWTPKSKGSNYKLSKILTPLEPIKDMVNVHTNLGHKGDGHGHFALYANFLCGAKVSNDKKEFHFSTSADQVAAKMIGQNSYLPSLELSSDRTPNFSKGTEPFNRTAAESISWFDGKTQCPREVVPSNVYSRLFKGAKKSITTPEETKSILDYVKEDTMAMKKVLGREDMQRISQYFASIRALERRIQKSVSDDFTMPRNAKTPPNGRPGDFREHIDLMMDIMILAFQTNRTKVASLILGNCNSQRKFPFLIGNNELHHQLTHHNNDKKKIDAVIKITQFYVSTYSKMLQKMHAIKEGDKSLLDNSLILFGSEMIDGVHHKGTQKPIIVGGKGGGSVKTGQHQLHPIGTPMNNLLLGMMNTAGCNISKFGDSTKEII